jgi:hypothetical protein
MSIFKMSKFVSKTMTMRTTLIKSTFLEEYKERQKISLLKHFRKIKEMAFNKDAFGYSVSVASVYSSMIEGNPIDLDTFMKYTDSGINKTKKSYLEIQDLIKAYEFTRDSRLSYDSMMKAHEIMTKRIIDNILYRGRVRNKEVGIYGPGGKIYSGAAVAVV